jgi:nucleoside-diphosphate-sugar epimerase
VANAVLATLLAGSADRNLAGEVCNVGVGDRYTLLDLARLMAERCGVPHLKPEFRPGRTGDVPHSMADISRAKALLGYTPIATLEDGLEETIAWYRREMAAAGGA